MSFLVINSGSSSVKYKIFNDDENELQSGIQEKVKDYEKTFRLILRSINNLGDVKAIAHRVVHGADLFNKATLINDKVINEIKFLNHLAPLHNPYNLAGIQATMEYLPNIPQWAVFDTSFFLDLPKENKVYAIPKDLAKKHHIQKYGFHGISHSFLLDEASKLLKKQKNRLNLITCHLGGGWSITAIKNGKAIDTSMGFTPLDGLVMMTRAGSIDPGIIFKLLEEKNSEDLYQILNKESGIKALSGGIDDFKELLRAINSGNAQAGFAFDVAIANLLKYIGAYYLELGGKVDALVLSGAIGAYDNLTKNEISKKIKCLNLKILNIVPNEELMIMREVKKEI